MNREGEGRKEAKERASSPTMESLDWRIGVIVPPRSPRTASSSRGGDTRLIHSAGMSRLSAGMPHLTRLEPLG